MLRVVQVVVVAVTKRILAFAGLLLMSQAVMLQAQAAVLPEDRADVMYHSYDGQNVEVTGPSVLVRKGLSQNVSVFANYYVDNISSASIDVVTQGSQKAYKETRREGSIGADLLYEDTTFTVGISSSEEDDYSANTTWFGLTQEFFGGLSTLSMGYARGADKVRKNGDPTFEEEVDRRSYRLGLTQVISRNALIGVTWETITDQGFLNNPYRQYRYINPDPNGAETAFAFEKYPNTRTSNAASVRGRYFLAPDSAVHGEYRYFSDDWDIRAHNIAFGYTRHLNSRWMAEAGYRYYTQTGADFFSNLFEAEDSQNFMGRDKETSPFDNHTLRFGVTYKFMPDGWKFMNSGSLNFNYEFIRFSYDEYTDNSPGTTLATEELLEFNAHVFNIFASFWF